ncbi:Gfo/Idh/MocA family protein [Sphaerisporangium corydalis]|uniref:Gfo/Idh/MocA family protein n=1 Tax=Sphaerisporangium corydalis TaxID=1441875 RepID=A0ABV9E8Y2_9ACTN|nr:Gfo/Idh/MocA family oxidoreductase [Sphaerisporangium corydalis]
MTTTRVAMIGLGDIAEKAYLPVLGATPGLDLLLCTRNRATLARLGDEYRIRERFTSVEQVIGAGVEAAFVHASTQAHPEIVTALLRAGVHVYVDKPLAYDLADAEKLVGLAGERGLSLMVGFNRRYAPGYAGLRNLPRDLIVMQKHRAGQPDDPRRVVFDDFIHVVDTLRFLAPGDISDTRIEVRTRGGLLEHVVLHLSGRTDPGSGRTDPGTGHADPGVGHAEQRDGRAETGAGGVESGADGFEWVGGRGERGAGVAGRGERGGSDVGGFTAIGMMSRVSGSSEETCEIIGGGGKRRIVNLAEVVDYDGAETVTRRGDWIPVARQRGIEQVCHEFLASLRDGRVISAADALLTHATCEQIVTAAGSPS